MYGPTLAPADTFLESQVQVARGVTRFHTFSQLMFDIGDVEREWANVCLVHAHTILHRSTEVARAARRLPAHRLEPHAEFSAGVFWKLVWSQCSASSWQGEVGVSIEHAGGGNQHMRPQVHGHTTCLWGGPLGGDVHSCVVHLTNPPRIPRVKWMCCISHSASGVGHHPQSLSVRKCTSLT